MLTNANQSPVLLQKKRVHLHLSQRATHYSVKYMRRTTAIHAYNAKFKHGLRAKQRWLSIFCNPVDYFVREG